MTLASVKVVSSKKVAAQVGAEDAPLRGRLGQSDDVMTASRLRFKAIH